ncbi:hypothetical protein [Alicyclobacillus shizuokensis]|uniref:hypothetical protein n=1 Tax=Alicyclobacillus shizuokensis TaxID=392014 RepID=UPI00082B7FB3|nr:hypothetical protein [Alicyclobacillus shizuokensis]MCL6627536.1 hypothetical protein [Alicyclobacillus shizuokensis]
MRVVLLVVSAVVAVVSGWQALWVAEVGAEQQIPQLEGDGGAGLVFALLCLAGGVAALFRRWLGCALFSLAALAGVWAGVVFADLVTGLWAVAPLALGFVAWWKGGRCRGRSRTAQTTAHKAPAI